MNTAKQSGINVDGCVGTALRDVVSTQSEVQEAVYNSATTSTADQGASFEEEDYDDDIEVISKILEPEVTLTNGKKVAVQKIIDAIYKPKDLDFYLKKLTPETSQLVKKAIALKLASDLFND
ncbi:MAG: hypothetical protein LN589_02745 [Rickettsia endosymbiont of Eriopis connexa]|nr:hypothetical protein [Rickettsia endosymbiont of Eriopis connexa]